MCWSECLPLKVLLGYCLNRNRNCFGFGLWNAVTSWTALFLLWLRLTGGWGNWMAAQERMGSSARSSSYTARPSPKTSSKTYTSTSFSTNLFLSTHTHKYTDIQSNARPETGEICSPSLPEAGGAPWWLKCHDEQRVPAENDLMTLLHFSGLIVMSLNWSCW